MTGFTATIADVAVVLAGRCESNSYRHRGKIADDDQRGEFHFSPVETPQTLHPPQAVGN
jgi:hypothetical protein